MVTLENVNLAFRVLCGLLVALLLCKDRLVWATLKTFFFERSLPVNLGLMRMFIFAILLLNAIVSPAVWYAGVPESFRDLPPGWEWTSEILPITPGRLQRAQIVLIVTSALAVVGLFTRPACIIAAILSIYVFGVPNFYFKIGHGMHVPVLSALVVAASPAGDGASLDAWLRRRRGQPSPAPSVAYTVPVRFCWMLVGTMYLFPGLWKLWTSGDQWINGTKLRVELFNKWAQIPDYVPSVRVDEMPAVLIALGVMTLVIEIGYLPALFHRTTRVLAGLGAAGFHIGVGLTMDIWFNPLHPLIVLIDFPAVLQFRAVAPIVNGLAGLSEHVRRRRAAGRGAPPPERAVAAVAEPEQPPELAVEAAPVSPGAAAPPVSAEVASPPVSAEPPAPARRTRGFVHSLPAWIVGTTAFGGMLYTGIYTIDTWPVAIYPRFHHRVRRAPTDSSALRLVVRGKDGTERVLPHSWYPIEDTAAIFRIARATQRLKKKKKQRARFREHVELLAYYAKAAHGPFKPGDKLLVYSMSFKVDPAKRGEPTLSLIAETELD